MLNDDGTYSMSIAGCHSNGIWTPDEHVSYLIHFSPELSEYIDVIYNNEVRWDIETDSLFMGLSKEDAIYGLRNLFQGEEEYIEVYCKTYRERTKILDGEKF